MMQSLEMYFQKYYTACYRAAFTLVKNHADAEDVAQETLLRLLVYQPNFKGEQHEKALMIRTAMNLAKDLLKSKWKKSTVHMEVVPETERTYFQIPSIESDETLFTVLELPKRYRSCLYLFYYEDYSVREIADILKLGESNVKIRLSRGRALLRETLKEEWNDDK